MHLSIPIEFAVCVQPKWHLGMFWGVCRMVFSSYILKRILLLFSRLQKDHPNDNLYNYLLVLLYTLKIKNVGKEPYVEMYVMRGFTESHVSGFRAVSKSVEFAVVCFHQA